MKRYEKYKDSGIEWIGEVPENWSVCPFKWLNNGLNTGEAIDKSHWTNVQGDTVFYTAGLKPITTDYQNFPKEKYTGKDDLLLARNGTPYVYYPPLNAIYTDHIIRAIINSSNCKKYIYYAIRFAISHEVVDSVSIATWSASLWNEQKIALPSKKEQREIAEYLDYKVGKIDKAVEGINAQIEDLKGYRQSVISEAVTKGVNRNVKMKDSGVEWIGKIPDGWSVLKTKFVLLGIQDGTHGTFDRTDSGYPLLSAKNISDNEIIITDKESMISSTDYNTIVANGFPQKGDVALCCVGSIGRCCIYLLEKPMAFQRSVTFLRPNNRVTSSYLNYYLKGNIFQDQLNKYAKTSAQSGIYLNDVANTLFILPPKGEQEAIARYLDEKTGKIDKAIRELEMQREDLGALKQSVISEAVTGKVDVRGWNR